MNADQSYIGFIRELKQNIVQSRYIAARLANKEQLLLYIRTGTMLTDTIKREKWGAKVLERISEDLQHELPGIKGFSAGNLKKMRIVAEAYSFLPIGSTVSNQLVKQLTEKDAKTSSAPLNQLATGEFIELCFSITFSHHFLILTKVKDWQERMFYIKHAATNFWSLTILEYHIGSQLYQKQGALPNNFTQTLPATIKATALEVFKDEYLFDFVSLVENEDEKVLEASIIANIKQAIMRLGKGFSFIGNQYQLQMSDQ